jgi:hypothetical protein
MELRREGVSLGAYERIMKSLMQSERFPIQDNEEKYCQEDFL